MDLVCSGDHEHTICKGSRTGATSYYTPMFAKRVCRAILEPELWATVRKELLNTDHCFEERPWSPLPCICHSDKVGQECFSCHLKEALGDTLPQGKQHSNQEHAFPVAFDAADPAAADAGGAEIGDGELTPQQKREVLRKISVTHSATGHCTTDRLVDALKRRNVSPAVLHLAKDLK
jgi:hypothetical protein